MTAHAYTQAEVEGIAQRLGGFRTSGGGWKCRCPAHNDRTPSLSLSLGEGGSLLWHCFAGCDQAAVLDGLKASGVLLNGDARPAEPRPKPRARPRQVAAYVYADENNRPLFRVIRMEPKSFPQERFENGRWIGGKGALDGVRRVLYRLPEVVAADEVIVAEGEKDVDNLREAGFVATTNPGGAGEGKDDGKKWLPAYSDTLAGKRVVILPDNDQTGRKHAAAVARSLHGKAAGVKVLELPGLPPKGDVSDWLAAGHDAEELRALIAEAPEWEAREPEPGTAAGDPRWRRRLLQIDNGPLACEANVEIALRHAPELVDRLRFNELTGAAECSSPPWCRREGWRAWADNDDTALAVWCQHAGVRVKPAACAAAVQLVAADHPHHPVRAYLDGLEWGGAPRLDTWLHAYLGVKVEEVAEGAADEKRQAAEARWTATTE